MKYLMNEKRSDTNKVSILQWIKNGKKIICWDSKDLWQKTMHQSNAFSKYFKGKNGSEVGRGVQKKTIKENKEGIQGRSYGLYEKGLETRKTSLENRSKSTPETIRSKKNKSRLYFDKSKKWAWLFKLQARTQGNNGKTFRQEIKKRRSCTSYQSRQERQSVIKSFLNDFLGTQEIPFERQFTESLTIS